MKKIMIVLVLFILCACTYEVKTRLPDNIKSIYIDIIRNDAFSYRLEENLTRLLTQKFMQDGRLFVATNKKDADSVMSCRIQKYKETPHSYDEHNIVNEYKLDIGLHIKLSETKSDTIIFETDDIKEWTVYIPKESSMASKNPLQAETEEDAGTRLIEILSQRIINRTLDGWQY